MASPEDDSYESNSLITTIKTTLLTPRRLLLSRTSMRAYLRTALFLLASIALFAIAVAAYASFYYAYVPARGFTLPVHLSFDESYLDAWGPASRHSGGVLESVVGNKHAPAKLVHPSGVVPLAKGSVASEQKYDVSVTLDLPRSEQNLAVGNFMVEVALLGPGPPTATGEMQLGAPVLVREERAAMLTYRSWMVETAWRVTRLPWYLVGWQVESERVVVRVLEAARFEKGWRSQPGGVRVEVRSGRGRVLQVYGVSVEFRARFEGLRYIMYNHRIISLVVFTTLFWTVEMAFLLFTWGLFTLFFSSSTSQTQSKTEPKKEQQSIKADPDAPSEDAESLSDASRTFPTFSRQPPLRYSTPRVKEEENEGAMEDLPPRTPGDADDEDEDEDADFVLDETPMMGGPLDDSGLGTSMESGVEGRGTVRRRSGGPAKDRA
ncbi:uncharacterized protein BDZ99DRAFT_568046 [Mytilinidion resinicola]|uniref:Adipose-regulatory protein-domain-containing protein n=1 Tax=Mytilinidion resinicola TaxID=574789 RepID=A0A6A6Z151_9PEZI|nr:uncharacterized protein BDZ99DRAFT_568046 [Mytilinidion resinicola]KAF2814423.1 hypothetical protein BDZ99DRAFT_568046 [Mytilinidion resinicola]